MRDRTHQKKDGGCGARTRTRTRARGPPPLSLNRVFDDFPHAGDRNLPTGADFLDHPPVTPTDLDGERVRGVGGRGSHLRGLSGFRALLSTDFLQLG